jgi:hypothetical protein
VPADESSGPHESHLGTAPAKVVADITMALDGFVTGPDPGPEIGVGRGGEDLHAWVVSGHEFDAEMLRESAEAPGAVVTVRRLFDVVDGPHGWSDEMGCGGEHATRPRFFVLAHAAPERVRFGLERGTRSAKRGTRPGETRDSPRRNAGLARRARVSRSGGRVSLGSGTLLLVDCHRRRLVRRHLRVSPHASHLTYALRS